MQYNPHITWFQLKSYRGSVSAGWCFWYRPTTFTNIALGLLFIFFGTLFFRSFFYVFILQKNDEYWCLFTECKYINHNHILISQKIMDIKWWNTHTFKHFMHQVKQTHILNHTHILTVETISFLCNLMTLTILTTYFNKIYEILWWEWSHRQCAGTQIIRSIWIQPMINSKNICSHVLYRAIFPRIIWHL